MEGNASCRLPQPARQGTPRGLRLRHTLALARRAVGPREVCCAPAAAERRRRRNVCARSRRWHRAWHAGLESARGPPGLCLLNTPVPTFPSLAVQRFIDELRDEIFELRDIQANYHSLQKEFQTVQQLLATVRNEADAHRDEYEQELQHWHRASQDTEEHCRTLQSELNGLQGQVKVRDKQIQQLGAIQKLWQSLARQMGITEFQLSIRVRNEICVWQERQHGCQADEGLNRRTSPGDRRCVTSARTS